MKDSTIIVDDCFEDPVRMMAELSLEHACLALLHTNIMEQLKTKTISHFSIMLHMLYTHM